MSGEIPRQKAINQMRADSIVRAARNGGLHKVPKENFTKEVLLGKPRVAHWFNTLRTVAIYKGLNLLPTKFLRASFLLNQKEGGNALYYQLINGGSMINFSARECIPYLEILKDFKKGIYEDQRYNKVVSEEVQNKLTKLILDIECISKIRKGPSLKI